MDDQATSGTGQVDGSGARLIIEQKLTQQAAAMSEFGDEAAARFAPSSLYLGSLVSRWRVAYRHIAPSVDEERFRKLVLADVPLLTNLARFLVRYGIAFALADQRAIGGDRRSDGDS